jgi:Family of unknown function (DUF5994)
MAPHAADQMDVLSPVPPASRLSLDPALGRRAILGGGWWPRSRDARVELPDLIDLLNARVGAVVRLGVDARDWDDIPRNIMVGGHRVRVGWFADLDHKIIATRGPQDHIMLLVVPPHASTAGAKSALALAAAGKNGGGPEEILAAAGIDDETGSDSTHSADIGALHPVANGDEAGRRSDDGAPAPELPARQPN